MEVVADSKTMDEIKTGAAQQESSSASKDSYVHAAAVASAFTSPSPSQSQSLDEHSQGSIGTALEASSKEKEYQMTLEQDRIASPTESITLSGSNESHSLLVEQEDAPSMTDKSTTQMNTEMDRSGTRYKPPSGRMPRQWIIDRCDGTSKYNPDSRPPCRICYVPIPVKWCPDILEQNCVCESMGRIGGCCIHPENTPVRRNLLRTAFVINVIGLLCLIVSMLSITTDHFKMIWRVEYSMIWLQLISGPGDFTNVPVFWAVGLRAIAYDNEITKDTGILPFGDVCAMLEHSNENPNAARQGEGRTLTSTTVDPTLHMVTSRPEFHCSECEEISRRIVPSLFLSMLSYIPNFTTDILRMYSNYDVNCQKFLASTFSWISLATAIYTWVNYRRGCFDSLGTEPFAVNEDFERVDDDADDVFLIVNFQWRAGLGQICLGVATFLKVIDIVFNIILPTPSITRDFLEQVEYEWKYGRHCDESEEAPCTQVEVNNDRNDDDDDEEEAINNDEQDVKP